MRCVKSIYANTTSPFHLIVMDDSTPDMDDGTDLTPQWFERFCKAHVNADYYYSDVPYKNSLQVFKQAFEYCKTPYVTVVVNSMSVEPEWDIVGLQLMETDPQIGAVGFKTLRLGTELIESAGLAVRHDGALNMDIGRGQVGHRLSKVYECDTLQWAFILLRKEAVLHNLGEEVYNGWKGMEDFESCYTMRSKGWKMYYCGLGVGYHQTLATRVAKEQDDITKNFQNREIFAKRWGFWEDYHRVFRGLGEFYPEIKARPRTVRTLLTVDEGGKVLQKLDLEEAILPVEASALSTLVSGMTKGATFVEVGSWKGHSASIIGRVAKESGGHLYCVDHWKGNEGTWNLEEVKEKDIYEIFEYNLRALGLWDIITPMKMDSIEASKKFADSSIDVLFLDCDHRYAQFKADLDAWLPKVKTGGIFCGHDCEVRYSEVTASDKKRIDSHLADDYIEGFCHPGVVKGLYDYFHNDYSIIPGTRIWYKEA